MRFFHLLNYCSVLKACKSYKFSNLDEKFMAYMHYINKENKITHTYKKTCKFFYIFH